MALRIFRIAHLRVRPPGLAGGMSGARISHSWSESSLGYRHRDENIKGLQKPAMLLIKPHYLPSRTASRVLEENLRATERMAQEAEQRAGELLDVAKKTAAFQRVRQSQGEQEKGLLEKAKTNPRASNGSRAMKI